MESLQIGNEYNFRREPSFEKPDEKKIHRGIFGYEVSVNKMSVIEKIKSLSGCAIDVVKEKSDQISIIFSNKTEVSASYWRIVGAGVRISNFDHNQKYGHQKEVDAVEELRKIISGERITDAILEPDSGDIELSIGSYKFRIFNFTGYEVWEISFPDGTGEYSNYV